VEYELLGWPEGGPTLRLDHERFAYAGKFVMSATGKAVARDRGEIVAAAAFDADRTDGDRLRIRYVTVRRDRRGEGIGPRLLRFVRERAVERGYVTVAIAVNNPFAYEAAAKAGFAYTGTGTGIAELRCVWPGPDRANRYAEGLATFRDRDLSEAEESFLGAREDDPSPPPVVDAPG